MIDADKLIADFVRVAELAGLNIKQGNIKIENLPAPHIPPKCIASRKDGSLRFPLGRSVP